MELFFTGVYEDAITVYVTLIGDRLVRLSAVVERYRICPDILPPFADLLPIVLPMDPVPVKVVVDAVLETGPYSRARIGSGRINHDRACRRSPAVVYPVPATSRTLLIRPLNVVAKWSCVPDVDGPV